MYFRSLVLLFVLTSISLAQQGQGVPTAVPDWCKNQPRPEYAKLKRVPSADPWFEVYEVAPKTYAIYEPHQAEEAISYLILGNTHALLFDTGLGIGNIKRVVEKITILPITVVNSHTHNDHVGDNWEFSDIAGMDTAFTRNSAKGSTADAQAELEAGNICGELPSGFNAKTYATKPWKITQWIHDGSKFDLGERTIEVIATPGHTPDALALLDRANGLLFTGDSYYQGPIYIYRPETDYDAYEHSIQRMAELAPSLKLLLPAHNVPVGDPNVLPRVLAAFRDVRAGKRQPTANGPNYIYQFEGFSFLVSKKF
ncbi:beta-lactamase-like protein [Candidatus Koribacter versatilis Ellin345]|uniref:Beta-lactamase-like protein n=1 Tax=Koribacter versatilis (strain Ellin345) TaxID=204669 RepID=Q1IPB4_KORVE|nr:MBL fold metallo-hydrolase [Candidatus Koribacter versatilis]ABF41286.1 beta-lactamase-like protein [Candidatus Koribacter versatilis Ellin345]